MERRVRVVVALLLLAAVVSLSVPLALTQADRRTARLVAERDRQLQTLVRETLTAASPAGPAERYASVYSEPVLVLDGDGRALAAAGGLDPDDPQVRDLVRRGLVDTPVEELPRVLPWTSDRPLRSASVVEGGEVVGLALTRVDTGAAAADLRRSWSLLVAVGLALVLLALVGARVLTRWTMRPVRSLEQAVRTVRLGERGVRVLPSGPPELRELVDDFNRMVEVVQASVDGQRRLVADTSHQLRNPLAALRLRADSLRGHLDADGAATHDGLVAELDRLERLLDQLMSLARAQESTTGLRAGLAAGAAPALAPLPDVVDGRLAAWAPAAAEEGQDLGADDVVDAAVPGDELAQVLDVLLDNAIRYAGRGARIRVAGREGAGETLVVTVVDDGPGLGGEDWGRATHRFWRGSEDLPGSGLGLAIAEEVVVGRGGGLTLRPADGDGGTVAEVVWPLRSGGEPW